MKGKRTEVRESDRGEGEGDRPAWGRRGRVHEGGGVRVRVSGEREWGAGGGRAR